MVELWFYSGRIGNCMFAYAFTRCIADTLKVRCSVPLGTEITKFPNIAEDATTNGIDITVENRDVKITLYPQYPENPKTVVEENDNMLWRIEKQFQSQQIKSYSEVETIQKVLRVPDAAKKWIVTLGNFETGEQYVPYRNKLKEWFKFPAIDYAQMEFWKIHPDLGENDGSWFARVDPPEITRDDLFISLRLEDYTTEQFKDKLLTYDYFKIILESRKWNKVVIMTNPGSIGHNDHYKFLKEFYDYDPIFVRCYEPVLSMAYGAQFNNIALSQSTYSWWLAFLSNAENVYHPIAKEGPWSLVDERYKLVDLRVPLLEWKYVDYETRSILPDEYYCKIDYENKKWID
jgi:hypothetical protein